jgi:hypothetical protein
MSVFDKLFSEKNKTTTILVIGIILIVAISGLYGLYAHASHNYEKEAKLVIDLQEQNAKLLGEIKSMTNVMDGIGSSHGSEVTDLKNQIEHMQNRIKDVFGVDSIDVYHEPTTTDLLTFTMQIKDMEGMAAKKDTTLQILVGKYMDIQTAIMSRNIPTKNKIELMGTLNTQFKDTFESWSSLRKIGWDEPIKIKG